MPVRKAQPLHSIAPLPQLLSFPPTLRAVICFLNQPLLPALPLFCLDFFYLFFFKERRWKIAGARPEQNTRGVVQFRVGSKLRGHLCAARLGVEQRAGWLRRFARLWRWRRPRRVPGRQQWLRTGPWFSPDMEEASFSADSWPGFVLLSQVLDYLWIVLCVFFITIIILKHLRYPTTWWTFSRTARRSCYTPAGDTTGKGRENSMGIMWALRKHVIKYSHNSFHTSLTSKIVASYGWSIS